MTASRPAESGLVVLDKPAGWTSHQVVSRIRRLLGTRKVGHAGTLDPMATGVLVVGVNRATRLLGLLALHDKAYAATIRLGIGTLTDDADGEVIAAPGATSVSAERLTSAVAALTGDIDQVPSAVSAIKIDGVRSYARVRAGTAVALPARPVRVSRFEVGARRDLMVEGVAVVDLDVEVECSTGTYVRALARDLGAALGTGGHLTALRRLRSGPFTVEEAQPLGESAPRLIDLRVAALRCFVVLTLTKDQAAAVRFGRELPDVSLPDQRVALLDPDGEFLALYTRAGSGARPEAVFATPR